MKKSIPFFAAALCLLALPWTLSAQEAAPKAKAKTEKTADAADDKTSPEIQAKIEQGIHQLETTLELNAEQTAQLRKIIGKSVDETQAELTRLKAHLELIKERTSVDIKKILDDKQKAKYDDLLSHQKQQQSLGPVGGPVPTK